MPPLLLFLGACGVRAEKAGPLTRRDDDDAGPQDTAAPPSADADLTPQARANLIRMCLKALSENTLQQSAIDELCTLAGLGPGNRDLIDSTNDVTWQGRPLKDGSRTPPAVDADLRACVIPEDDELLVWRFIDGAEPARYAGRVRETPSEVMTAETRCLDRRPWTGWPRHRNRRPRNQVDPADTAIGDPLVTLAPRSQQPEPPASSTNAARSDDTAPEPRSKHRMPRMAAHCGVVFWRFFSARPAVAVAVAARGCRCDL